MTRIFAKLSSMKVVILYRPNSEHDTLVQDYLRDYNHRTGKEIELVSLDSREGADMARLYDIVEYPGVLAVTDDGHLQKMWQGTQLPLMDELSYYDQNVTFSSGE